MFINIDNQLINYEISGTGKTVVFLHGWGGGLSGFAGCFNALKSEFRVVNLELPGFGESAPPAFPFDVDDYARIVYGFIKAVCIGGTSVSLVGHSFGGRIALVLAAEHPELIEKLVLIDSAGMKPRRGLKYRVRVCRYKLAKLFVKWGWLDKSRLEKYGSADCRALSSAMRGTFVKVVKQNLESFASRIAAPTLLIWGGKDRDTPLYMAKKLKKQIKGSELHVFPSAGHYSYIDNFKESNELIRKFIR